MQKLFQIAQGLPGKVLFAVALVQTRWFTLVAGEAITDLLMSAAKNILG